MSELKPCPFCGGKGSMRYHPHNAHSVECEECHASTSITGGVNRSVGDWNKRSQDSKAKNDAEEARYFNERHLKGLIGDYLRESLEVTVNCEQKTMECGGEELKVEVSLCLNGDHLDECDDYFYIEKQKKTKGNQND